MYYAFALAGRSLFTFLTQGVATLYPGLCAFALASLFTFLTSECCYALPECKQGVIVQHAPKGQKRIAQGRAKRRPGLFHVGDGRPVRAKA